MKRYFALFFSVLVLSLCGFVHSFLSAQDVLPPVLPWKGKSLELIADPKNPWLTPVEKSDFVNTPTYHETMQWLQKLCDQSRSMRMVPIGKSAQGRLINMVVASSENAFTKETLSKSNKPLLLIQAGIHSGEIDGKDAGMMLLREVAFGSRKNLLDGVNILFIPILSVDGHERSSPYNRVNQRGPANMGWRTNSRNLNLNRDYTKLDTEELRAVVKVIHSYLPDLYLDLHVTDGADYQYDITYGFDKTFSPSISQWLNNRLKPFVDKQLTEWGHIPGPLVFATNDVDFTEGMSELSFSARFSTGYGDLIHLPTILLENHSLKPFKQRVLGTFIFLEAIIKILSSDGDSLKKAIVSDRSRRNSDVVLTWMRSPVVDTITFLGIESRRKQSLITNSQYVEWTGKPISQKVAVHRKDQPGKVIKRPKIFWVPCTYKEIIQRLKEHGIQMDEIIEPKEIDAHMYKVTDYQFSNRPVEGHFTVTGKGEMINRKQYFYPGSVRISTDQPLGDLVIQLLHPESPDSFFQWGFFPEIFTRTEYMEQYVTEPLAAKMLESDQELKEEFENKKRNDPEFANDPNRIYEWFYERSPYFDSNWLIYPVAIGD